MRKKKIPEPTVTPKDASDLELFQAEHGSDYQKIVSHPALLSGLQLLSSRAFNELTSLSLDDIENHAKLILCILIGRLLQEKDVKNLHMEKTQTFPVEEEVVYISPEEQAEHAKLRERFDKERYV